MSNQVGRLLTRLKASLSQDLLGLLNDAAFVFACRVSGALFVLITQIVLARWIGAEQLGQYVLAFSWCMFLAAIAGMGFPRAAARFIGKGLTEKRDALVVGFVRRQTQISLFGGLVIAAGAVAIIALLRPFENTAGRDVMFLAMLAVPIFSMLNAHGATALAMSQFRLAFLPSTFFRPAMLLSAVSALWYVSGYLTATTVMGVHIAAALIALLYQARAVKQTLQGRFPSVAPSYESRLWMHTAPQLLVMTLFVSYFHELNVINTGMYLTAEQLAVYNVSLRLSILISFGMLAINAISMPKTARFHTSGDKAALQNLVTHVARLQLAWTLCAVIGLAVFGRYILSIFGPSFVPGYPALVILASAQLIAALFGPVAQLLSMTGHQNDCLYAFLSSFGVMLVLNHLLIEPLGINGAAITVALVFLVQSLWLRTIVIRELKLSPSPFSSSVQ